MTLGAGVSGLSSAILLMKKGYQVVIWAKDLPPNTTSDKAAAVWYPYLCYPRDKVVSWSRGTFEYIQKELLGDPTCGCITKKVMEIFDKPQDDPWWKDGFPGNIERLSKHELPNGYVDGYYIQGIVIDTSYYMDYLVRTFKNLGGKIIQKEVKNIQEPFQEYNLVVNCTGLGSRRLFNDDKIFPVRGQIVRVRVKDFDECVIDDEGPHHPALVISRKNDIVLGGTAQVNNWNTKPDPKDTEMILSKVKSILPRLKDIEIIGESVGLRPVRESVRLEAEKFGEKTIVHNYGHGGSGFTLSWGCAQDVVDIIESL